MTLLARRLLIRVAALVVVMLVLVALAVDLTYSSSSVGHKVASNGVINTDGSHTSSGITHAEHGVTIADGIQGSG